MSGTTTTETPVVRAVTYCRISADLDGQGAGVERQTVDTDTICHQRGWTIVERIVDNNRSASRFARKTREGWARMLELLETGAVDAVVAHNLDRLTRRPDDLAPLIRAAERGVVILTATGDMLDLSNDDGVFKARILLAVAEKEAGNARRRQKDKLRHDATNGRPHWPTRPFGFRLVPIDGTKHTRVEADDVEAAWFARIADWLIAGESATQVAVKLNAAGVAQPSGKPWQSSGVKLVFTNPRNIGKRAYHGKVLDDVEAQWPALLDEAQWRRACAALSLRSTGQRGGRRSMLTGMVRCGVCGATMSRTNSGDKAEWRCIKHADLGTGCGQSVKAALLEARVVELALIALGNVHAAKRPTKGTDIEAADAIRADLDGLADMFGRGELTMSEWRAAREPLQARLALVETTLTKVAATGALEALVGDPTTLAERWEKPADDGGLTVDVKRRLLGLVLDHVDVVRGEPRRRFTTDRIVPIWKA